MIKRKCKKIIFIVLIFANITACSNPVNTKVLDNNNNLQQNKIDDVDNKICNDSSVACEHINKNQTFPISLPEEKNSQKIELKFNTDITLTGKTIEDYSQICKMNDSERKEYYFNIYFKKENSKIILERFNQLAETKKNFSCPDGNITGIEFYDLGKTLLADVKNVPYKEYKESVEIQEGHSYAVKESWGYIDFSDPQVKSYIYVEKINKDGVTIILNTSNNK